MQDKNAPTAFSIQLEQSFHFSFFFFLHEISFIMSAMS